MNNYTARISVRGFECVRSAQAPTWEKAVKQFRRYTKGRLKITDSDVLLDISVSRLNDTGKDAVIAKIKGWNLVTQQHN